MTLPVPTQRTWATSDIVTAAMMNSNVRDAVNFGINPPALVAYSSVAQSLTNNANTAITFDTNVIDSYTGHSTVTNPSRYTAVIAGYYIVSANCQFGTNGTGIRTLALGKNGTVVPYSDVRVTPINGNSTGLATTQTFSLAAGDYVEAFAFQSSGGALNTVGAYCGMTLHWIHS